MAIYHNSPVQVLGYKKLKQQIVYLKGIKQVQLRALVMQTCSKVFILILFIAQLRFMYLGEVEISYEDVAAFLQVGKHKQKKITETVFHISVLGWNGPWSKRAEQGEGRSERGFARSSKGRT